jgi:hypothetical protein
MTAARNPGGVDALKSGNAVCAGAPSGASYSAILEAMTTAIGDWQAAAGVKLIHPGAKEVVCSTSDST